MDEDTFNAIRALHDVFYDLKDDGDGDDSSNRKEHYHLYRSIEPQSYNAYAAFEFIDAGDDSQQQEGQYFPPIQPNNYQDASSSSSPIHHDTSDSSGGKEQHHPSIVQSLYDAASAFANIDAGDASQQGKGQDYPTIESNNYHDASSSIHHDSTHRMLSTDLQLTRFDITTHSSCILPDINTVLIATILIAILVYPMIGTRRLRSQKWWMKNRKARRLTVSEGMKNEGWVTSSCAQDMLERGFHR